MAKCYHCGDEVYETFQCSECGQNYCTLHREPINHECRIVKESLSAPQPQIPSHTYTDVSTPQYQQQYTGVEPTSGVVRGVSDGGYTWYRQEKLIPENAFDKDSGIEFKGIMMPHKSEFLHLLIGAILIFVIGLIGFWNVQLIQMNLMWAIFMLAGFYTTAFLFHEFGHRQTAIHFGLQTKFRLLTFGMIITFFSLIMGLTMLIAGATPLPAFALPGAVVVLGLDKIDRKTGWCKAAGPIVNLVYGTILLVISLYVRIYPLNLFIGYAGFLNFSLGLFNMIPLGILDGQNIFKWNKGVYFLLSGSLLILVIITWMLISNQTLYLT